MENEKKKYLLKFYVNGEFACWLYMRCTNENEARAEAQKHGLMFDKSITVEVKEVE